MKTTNTRWFNVYPGNKISLPYQSKETADKQATETRLDCITLKWEEKKDENLLVI